MPVPLLLAMVLAFGLALPTESRPLSWPDLSSRLIETGLGVALVGLFAFIFGRIIAARARRSGPSGRRARHLFVWVRRAEIGLGLAVFAWTLFAVDWFRVVDWGLGLRDVMLVEELAILSPYLVGQGLSWCGLYRAERALQPGVAELGLAPYLMRKARQSMGMALPVAMIYALGRDVLRWRMPDGIEDPTIQFVSMSLLATLIFALSPAFVRLTWPTRRLEAGPLRDRLERLSRRLHFRCTDILVWDTGGLIVNAGVTGAVPWFRYVLITDAMIDLLDENEIEAVFGHEVGHIAHRHLPYFGLFFLGSIGLMSLAGVLVSRLWDYDAAVARLFPDPTAAEVVRGVVALSGLALYFFVVFGFLSRRFERQADIFGSRAVSCGRPDCPPHEDMNLPRGPNLPPRGLCPTGLDIFARALGNVAALNGMSPSARSWRHGSIARRIEFLGHLRSFPAAEGQFQTRVNRLRWLLGLGLAAASAAAMLLGSGEIAGP